MYSAGRLAYRASQSGGRHYWPPIQVYLVARRQHLLQHHNRMQFLVDCAPALVFKDKPGVGATPAGKSAPRGSHFRAPVGGMFLAKSPCAPAIGWPVPGSCQAVIACAHGALCPEIESVPMCGFLGGVLRRPVDESDGEVFRRAVRTLGHRGPDDEGVEVVREAGAVLAFRRLSIIDHSGGHQPMSTGAGQHIIFNGEIYNYAELRAGLERDGVRLRTHSDTEALLWTMTRKREAGLGDLVGMFAFAHVDVSRRSLLLARDRLGIKQLYYTETPEGFFFASEPKALLGLPWVSAELQTDQLAAYFNFRCSPVPNTLFRGIRKLGAGQVLRYDLDSRRFSIETYWAPPAPSERGQYGMTEALDKFEEAFLRAVQRRLVADVPVGAFLSGGLDSSLVVAGMRRLGHPDIATFSAVFPGSRDNEAPFARRVSERFKTRHFEHEATPDEFLGALPAWVELNDDLVADASCLPLFAVSRMARENGYIVLLSGEGSDELFGGYGSYHKFIGLNRLHRLLGSAGLRRAAINAMARANLLQGQDRPRAEEYLVRGGAFMGTAALLGRTELADLLAGASEETIMGLPRAPGRRMIDLCAFDFRTRIPEDLMVRTDRATMGASIEARVPFLDHHLVETVFGLAPGQRALPGVSKVMVRALAHRWGVPRETILHRKIGFQIPIGAWFRNELSPFWDRAIRQRVVPGIEYDQVARIYGEHMRGGGHFEEILWRIAALEMWYRRWILNESSAHEAGVTLSEGSVPASRSAPELVTR